MRTINNNVDIHTRTAAELYGVYLENVTSDMRRIAKTVNFGVIYGISSFGLSETLNIGRKEAEQYIKQYFDRHPGVKDYIEQLIAETSKKGFVTTLFGRKRPVPELKNQNKNIRQLGERLAVNSPIQGTAADIIKLAMISIRKRLREESLHARMILQVHDELLFELPESELQEVERIVLAGMEEVIELSVPLESGYRPWSQLGRSPLIRSRIQTLTALASSSAPQHTQQYACVASFLPPWYHFECNSV